MVVQGGLYLFVFESINFKKGLDLSLQTGVLINQDQDDLINRFYEGESLGNLPQIFVWTLDLVLWGLFSEHLRELVPEFKESLKVLETVLE